MNEINIEKINELLESVSTPEEVQSVLAQNGIEITVAEIMDMIRDNEELSAEDLDDVAGGCRGRTHIIGFRLVPVPIFPFFIIVPVYCKRR